MGKWQTKGVKFLACHLFFEINLKKLKITNFTQNKQEKGSAYNDI